MNLKNKKVLVAGTGISGLGAAKLLRAAGARVILYDSKEDLDMENLKERLASKGLELSELEVILGKLEKETISACSLAVISPGIPVDAPFVEDIRACGMKLWGEIELAYAFSKGRVAAITGTNGKTTTTSLLGEIFKAYFDSVFVVGNIGKSYTERALETRENSVIAAEISSFQLETIENFHPYVSAVLNVTPDHLNRHYTMENYAAVKMSVMKNQTAEDFVVLNYEDEYTRAAAENTQAKVIFFSSRRALRDGYYYENGEIIRAVNGEKRHICFENELKILGIHNMENIMAAVAIAECFHVPSEVIYDTLIHFKAVAHRIEYVATKKGVDYYNDSKGTNTDAAIKAVEAMVKPTLIIGGGYDKNVTFDEWIEAFGSKVKLLVLIGATADKIEACARKHGFNEIERADSLLEAVRICADKACDGDAVLLSPACASWGMFKDYEQRGDMFKEYVHALED